MNLPPGPDCFPGTGGLAQTRLPGKPDPSLLRAKRHEATSCSKGSPEILTSSLCSTHICYVTLDKSLAL